MCVCVCVPHLWLLHTYVHTLTQTYKSLQMFIQVSHSQQEQMMSCQSDLHGQNGDGEECVRRRDMVTPVLSVISCGGISGCNPWHRLCLCLCFSYRPDTRMLWSLDGTSASLTLQPGPGASSQDRHTQAEPWHVRRQSTNTVAFYMCHTSFIHFVCTPYMNRKPDVKGFLAISSISLL